MQIVRVQTAAIDVAAAMVELGQGRPEIGGIGCFLGTVRGQSGGRDLVAMTLEHYPAMTEAAMARVAAQAADRFPLLGCLLIHRVGRLLPGETIVLCAAASAHRGAALDATGFLIDWLKTKAPFWKKETFADGTETWVDARDSDADAAAAWGT